MTIEVVTIAAEGLAQTMRVVEHRGDAVESEAVEVELLEPVLAVREQEVQYVVLTIVEAKRVPSRMLVTVAGIEELVGIASQIAQAFYFVLNCVTMNNIHNNANAQLMSLIDQGLQLFGRAEAAAGSEERADMIAERAIVGVLLNGHDLNGVVTVLGHSGQHVQAELVVGAHLLGILTHAHMALVDEQRVLLRTEASLLPHVGHGRVPHLCREYLGLVVLHHTAAPGGNTLALATVPLHLHLVQLTVLQVFLLQLQLPVASALNTLAAVLLIFLPVVEVAYEVDVGSVRCPLAEHPSARQLVQAEVEMARGKVAQLDFSVLRQLADFPQCVVVTAANGILIGFQPSVVLYETDVFRSGLFCFLDNFLWHNCMGVMLLP